MSNYLVQTLNFTSGVHTSGVGVLVSPLILQAMSIVCRQTNVAMLYLLQNNPTKLFMPDMAIEIKVKIADNWDSN